MSKSTAVDENTQSYMQQILALIQDGNESQRGISEHSSEQRKHEDVTRQGESDVDRKDAEESDSFEIAKDIHSDSDQIESDIQAAQDKQSTVKYIDDPTGSPPIKRQRIDDAPAESSVIQSQITRSPETCESESSEGRSEKHPDATSNAQITDTRGDKSISVSSDFQTETVDSELTISDTNFRQETGAISSTQVKKSTSDGNTSVSESLSVDQKIIKATLTDKHSPHDDVKCTEMQENPEILTASQQKCPLHQFSNSATGGASNSSSAVTSAADQEPNMQYEISLTDQPDLGSDTNVDSLSGDDLNTEALSEDKAAEQHSFTRSPVEITSATSMFEEDAENYLRGCKWSPDGSCVLTNSNDNCLRLFNLPETIYKQDYSPQPELTSALQIQESDLIYDYCWFPQMSSLDPASCCLVTSCRDTPLHMWDAFTGCLRCTYRAYNHVDEITAAHSVAFSLDGDKLYCGFNKTIRIFDVNSPGRDCLERPTFEKKSGQSGIISCISASPQGGGLYAAGSYSKSIALYYEPKGGMVCMFQGQIGGVTHIMFSPDGTKLYSGGRKDPEILCWDLRNPGQILFTAVRQVETNQRIYFDMDYSGKYLVSGNQDGTVSVWDTMQQPVKVDADSDPVLKPILSYTAHNDTVNGISVHPSLPLLATASGQRHFPALGDSSDSDSDDVKDLVDNFTYSLKLWWTGQE